MTAISVKTEVREDRHGSVVHVSGSGVDERYLVRPIVPVMEVDLDG